MNRTVSNGIVTIVSLYNPTDRELETIQGYLPYLDRCILMDDSECCEKSLIIEDFFKKSDVEYIWNGGNIGLSRSLNKGIDKAREYGAEWILFMDSDSNFFTNIISVYQEYITMHDTLQIAMLVPQHNYNRHKRHPEKGERLVKKAMLSGCLFNVSVLEHIGIFDERFFIDGLDYEWCERAIKNGYKIVECREAVINHNPAIEKQIRILGKVILRYGWDTPVRYYYQFRAMFLLHKLYGDIFLDMSMLFKPIKAFLLFDKRRDYFLAWKQAKADSKSGYYGRYIQKKRE